MDVENVTRSKKEQAKAFIKKLKKEKTERERQMKMMNDAKDEGFLAKLQQTLANRI